jgi:hypothetical protein
MGGTQMNPEEYKAIRDEMLQRLKWTFELVFFSIASTAALLSWLSTQAPQAESNPSMNPFLFACIGLVIIGYLFHSYRELLRQIYSQGSYLAVFYEGDEQGFNWHRLSRCNRPLIGLKSSWGRDGRRGALLLILLLVANIFGPLYLLRENMSFDGWQLSLFIFMIVLTLIVVRIIASLLTTAGFMKKDFDEWMQVKDTILKNPGLSSSVIKQLVGSKGPKANKVLKTIFRVLSIE